MEPMNYEEEVKKIDADRDKKLKELETRQRIIDGLPEGLPSPDLVVTFPLYGSLGSVKFQVEKPGDVLPILELIKNSVVPCFVLEGNFTSFKPYDDGEGAIKAELFCWLAIDKFRAKVECWMRLTTGEIVGIDIDVKDKRAFGQFVKDKPNARDYYRLMFEAEDRLLGAPFKLSYGGVARYGENSARDLRFGFYDIHDARVMFEDWA